MTIGCYSARGVRHRTAGCRNATRIALIGRTLRACYLYTGDAPVRPTGASLGRGDERGTSLHLAKLCPSHRPCLPPGRVKEVRRGSSRRAGMSLPVGPPGLSSARPAALLTPSPAQQPGRLQFGLGLQPVCCCRAARTTVALPDVICPPRHDLRRHSSQGAARLPRFHWIHLFRFHGCLTFHCTKAALAAPPNSWNAIRVPRDFDCNGASFRAPIRGRLPTRHVCLCAMRRTVRDAERAIDHDPADTRCDTALFPAGPPIACVRPSDWREDCKID